MNTDIEFVQKFNLAYNTMCKPLCQQLKLPQTAFDILMFFGNNPEYRTASDVVEIRKIKAKLPMTAARHCCSARKRRGMSSKRAA